MGFYCWCVAVGALTCAPGSLASILSKRTLAQSKLDEIKIKSNILKAFILEKSEAVIGRKADEL